MFLPESGSFAICALFTVDDTVDEVVSTTDVWAATVISRPAGDLELHFDIRRSRRFHDDRLECEWLEAAGGGRQRVGTLLEVGKNEPAVSTSFRFNRLAGGGVDENE